MVDDLELFFVMNEFLLIWKFAEDVTQLVFLLFVYPF